MGQRPGRRCILFSFQEHRLAMVERRQIAEARTPGPSRHQMALVNDPRSHQP
jgi:hypothetical protein